MYIGSIAKATYHELRNFDVRSTTFPALMDRTVRFRRRLLLPLPPRIPKSRRLPGVHQVPCSDDKRRQLGGRHRLCPATKARKTPIFSRLSEQNPLMQASMDQRADTVQWTQARLCPWKPSRP
jgi:hypothetical protein